MCVGSSLLDSERLQACRFNRSDPGAMPFYTQADDRGASEQPARTEAGSVVLETVREPLHLWERGLVLVPVQEGSFVPQVLAT